MSILGNLLLAIAQLMDALLSIYMWIVIVSTLISWVNPDPYNPIIRFLRSATEPVLRPIRRRIGILSGIDISPLIVILAILFIKSFMIISMTEIAYKMKGTSTLH